MAAHMQARRNGSMCSLTLCKLGHVEGYDFRENRGGGGGLGGGGASGAGTGGAATEGGGSGTLVSGRAKEATPRRQHYTPAHSPDHSAALAT